MINIGKPLSKSLRESNFMPYFSILFFQKYSFKQTSYLDRKKKEDIDQPFLGECRIKDWL